MSQAVNVGLNEVLAKFYQSVVGDMLLQADET